MHAPFSNPRSKMQFQMYDHVTPTWHHNSKMMELIFCYFRYYAIKNGSGVKEEKTGVPIINPNDSSLPSISTTLANHGHLQVHLCRGE